MGRNGLLIYLLSMSLHPLKTISLKVEGSEESTTFISRGIGLTGTPAPNSLLDLWALVLSRRGNG